MKKQKGLFKTRIIIWSEWNPQDFLELEELAREATEGDAYCSVQESKYIENFKEDPDWDGTEFFEGIV